MLLSSGQNNKVRNVHVYVMLPASTVYCTYHSHVICVTGMKCSHWYVSKPRIFWGGMHAYKC